jgi:hypothetical protein
MKRPRIAGLFGVVLLLGGGAGCATSRGILDIQVPMTADPAAGPTVVITRVTDARPFEIDPRDPSVPSLKGDEIGDKAITSRAIARKRNTYGMALGDILLPEGHSVEMLVREALATALRHRGYRVVQAEAGAAGAGATDSAPIPLEADIRQYWSWFTPGFWALELEFEAILDLRSPVVGTEQRTVRGYVLLHSQAATGGAWRNTINKGNDSLIREIEAVLVAPGAEPGMAAP